MIRITCEKDFDILFRAHYNHLVLYTNNFVNCMEVSEDIVQDLFIKIWGKRDSLTITPVFLFVCAKNAAVSYIRTRKIKTDLSIDISTESHMEEMEVQMEYYKKLEQVNELITQLSPQCRIVLEKIYFESKKYEEVAQELNISVNTVKYHLKTAIRLLRKDFYIIISFLR